MGQASSIRGTVRNLIQTLGKTCSRYSYEDATKTTNEEGDVSISWGSSTSFKAVSSNNLKYKKIGALMGIETDTSGRVLIAKDTITVEKRDKITIGDDTYEVGEIKNLDPIEDDVIIAKRITLKKHEGY